MNIRLLTRNEIDTERWNKTVDASPNGLIYATTGYLDLMTDTWQGIVIDNYRAVMPIPSRKKWGITYVCQLPFIQQLGLIGSYEDEELTESMAVMQKAFKYGDYAFNFLNYPNASTAARNYVLGLSSDYPAIAKGYRYDHRKNLQGDSIGKLDYNQPDTVSNTIRLYQELYHHKFQHVSARSFDNLIRFAAQTPVHAFAREARENGELLSAILVLKDNKRLYTVVSATTDKGKKLAANRFLIDRLIREFAGNDLLLDFEGSDLPGVAEYYEGFGAELQPYHVIKWNHLPAPIRWFKK